MKKIAFFMLIIMLLAAAMDGVQAQRPIGDTLQCPSMDTTYYRYINDWPCTHELGDSLRSFTLELLVWYLQATSNTYWPSPAHVMDPRCWGNKIVGNQMVADRPLKVVGIAGCGYVQPWKDTVSNYRPWLLPNTVDTMLAGRVTDSLLLYTITSKGPELLTGGPWRPEYPHRYMTLPQRDSTIVNGGVGFHDFPTVPLYEVLLDTPQVVTDSFLVAGTCNNNELVQVFFEGSEYRYMWLWERRPTRYWQIARFYDPVFVPDTDHVTWIKFQQQEWRRVTLGARFVPSVSFPIYCFVIFPIIDPDFDTVLCDGVRDVRVAEATDTTLTLMWNGGNNVEWEVQYAEVNGWNAWTVTTTVPMVTLTGLQERTNYMVRVRGKCEEDGEFGEWSGWLDVYTEAHHDDPPVGISNLERFTQMMPNPARGQVTVLSSYRLSRVVVYDLAGHAVMELEDDGLGTTFDVSGLAKGVYVVAIHTPAGIATKRLVVGSER